MSKGPLREIMFIERFADDAFGTNKVKLVCGHTVRSNGIYRARCHKCAESGDLAEVVGGQHDPL